MRTASLLFSLALAGCAPATPIGSAFDTATRAVAAPVASSTLPPMKSFGAPQSDPAQVSNTDLARDFLDLSFRLESGRTLPVLTRFEGPVTLRVTGQTPPTLAPDLSKLLYRLRTEAGIDIRTTNSANANIIIQAVTRTQIRQALPQAACFVVPNVASISEYRRARRSPDTNWGNLQTRRQIAIFLPNDVSPQETRDCLHEELAQALGPLNDLYRLTDSVFNDDNVHTVLTGFDMLILRATYDSDLRSGMSRAEVAARLPAILARINPTGETLPRRFAGNTPAAFVEAIQTALGPGSSPRARSVAANTALTIAQSRNWTGNRRAFAHYAAGRIAQAVDSDLARTHFQEAARFYAAIPGTALHQSYVAAQLAAYAVAAGDGTRALRLVNRHLPAATRSENAALLATLLMMKSEALQLTGQTTEARSVRLDSLGWARYGFGPDWAVRAKEREIAALNPLNGRS